MGISELPRRYSLQSCEWAMSANHTVVWPDRRLGERWDSVALGAACVTGIRYIVFVGLVVEMLSVVLRSA
jgi:hypothetical protein